jgi:hypothetical protein
MTNTELLNWTGVSSRCLTHLEKQRQYVFRRALERMECPHCLKGVSKVEAAGVDPDDYDTVGGDEPDFACPHCKTELEFVLPMSGNQRWRRKKPAEILVDTGKPVG